MKDFKIRIARADFGFRNSRQINIFACQVQGRDYFLAQPLEFKIMTESEEERPFVQITVQEAQILMDDLWECGVRPSEGTGSAGSLKATQNHLADIKQILFHKLGITKDK